ncbi:copper resistance CopC family protein [Catellatospora tritici]|uniref:copper resistance CopC family protein n=1 Tax=Catellatospora tritici TaxID=2851566 RepID=UPI001C2D1238|nr:copper resistance CopC family protein [Catellatospora tritici]MBV1854963.1 copper resistance protein CopC [Catellatospora tritici]
MTNPVQRTRTWAYALVAAVAAALLALVAQPAWAHNSLVSASPAKNAALTAPPAQVTLKFLATLKKDGAKLTVTGPDGASAADAPAISGKTISAKFSGTTGGAYQVAYEVSSEDGHVVQGSYTFTLAGQPSPAPVTESATVPSASPSTAAPGSPSPAQAQPNSGDDKPWWPWIGGAVVAGLLVGGLLNLVKRRRGQA